MGFVKKHTGIDVAAPVKAVQSGISSIGNATGISPALTKVFQPLEKAFVQPVGQGLASFDKMVGNTIPGGWGTVASIAGSAMGVPTPYLVGLGALNGSGVTRKGGSFNLQGALIGGATAYASAKMGDYLRSAAPGADGLASLNPSPTVDAAGNLTNVIDSSGFAIDPNIANASGSAVPNIQNVSQPSLFSSLGSETLTQPIGAFTPNPTLSANGLSPYAGNITPIGMGGVPQAGPGIIDRIGTALSNAPANAAEYVSNLPGRIADSASNAYDSVTKLSNYTDAIDKGLSNASQTGAGIKNLVMGPTGVSKAASALSGVNPVTMGGMALYGATSLSALDSQRDMLKQQLEEGKIAQAEYDAAVAEINRQAGIASESVAGSPFSTNPNRDVSIGETYYGRNDAEDTVYGRGGSGATLYAMGGSVDDELGMDEARSLGLGNLSNGFMNMGSTPAYAAGGQPRFLSGGGDGMSDSIKASINGTQEARLADGEFVIPADVVSHLGNGSSKAGAKRLYSMMDKVRVARTGTKQQGKQINPRKYLGV